MTGIANRANTQLAVIEGGRKDFAVPFSEPLTFIELNEAIAYHPDDGTFWWKISPSKNVFAGMEAGRVSATRTNAKGEKVKYRYIRFREIDIPAARVAWVLQTGEWPPGKVMFEDGDPLNIRFSNLRLASSLPGVYDHSTPDGRSEYLRDHRQAFKADWKGRYLERQFGIPFADYLKMIAAQDNKCAICAREETVQRGGETRTLAVDHDHATNAIRGLLCQACNQGLGNFRDDPARLRAAADYIDRHRRILKVVE